MSIATELTKLQTNITNAYNAIRNKGGTVPTSQTLANLPTAINSISGGSAPSGKILLTSMNEINVANYATAQVSDNDLIAENIRTGINILGITGTYSGSGSSSIGVATQIPDTTSTSITFTGLQGNPLWFFCFLEDSIKITTTPICVNVAYDGGIIHGQYTKKQSDGWFSSNYYIQYSMTNFLHSYSNGSLILSTTSSSYGSFYHGSAGYKLIYGY